MSSPPRISKLTFARNASPIGIGQARPSLSWRYEQDISTEENWVQKAFEISLNRRDGKESTYRVELADHVEVAWPKDAPALASRERVGVKVRARGGQSNGWTEWYTETVEAALLDRADWSAQAVGPDIRPPSNLAKRPFYIKSTFKLPKGGSNDQIRRIYATALGVYELSVNGSRIGDHVMAPGWQSYNHRLHYQTYTIPSDVLVKGENTIEAVVGEGWYSGRLTWDAANRNLWGDETGVMIQLEVDGRMVALSGPDWEWSYGPMLSSELYDGEMYDLSIGRPSHWRPVKTIPLPSQTTLIAPEAPPIRRTEEIKPQELISTPKGKKILDFGQNVVGWVKLRNVPKKVKALDGIVLRFAEVLDQSELGVRPLRAAKATDHIYLNPDEGCAEWEPKFTTHGFRYCEVTGPANLLDDYKNNFVAVVVHSDMERLGDFTCSHALVNKLHDNVARSLRGNFVGLPTDCPQRDERLGWTGDLEAFASTASFLYDTSGFLANWFADLSEEQIKDNHGVPPLVVPNTLMNGFDSKPMPQAVWGDVCVLAPFDLYEAYGSKTVLRDMWESMTTWLDKGIPRGDNGLWLNPRDGFQFADWLDPRAPPDQPAAALTDQYLVADAFLVGIARAMVRIATILDLDSERKRYTEEHARLRKAFQNEYLSPSGRLSSDSQTAYCLAYQFDLLDAQHLPGASERLLRLVTTGEFRIGTGFAGTPGILHALVQAGHLQLAYRMLQEKGCPSWLYPITMGATTIWERWDSMLPDGSINPGEMTSFNHYALGAVANFLHTTVAGLKPLSPGYRKILVQPRPGGSLTSASAHTMTPYGRASVAWTLKDGKLQVDVEVPPNATAVLRLTEMDETVGSGIYSREVKYDVPQPWPPSYFGNPIMPPKTHETLAE